MTKDDVFVSTVKVSGRYPALIRLKTGLFSFDYALSHKGNLGLPLRVFVELYGYTNSGKSTLAYFLAGKVANEMKKKKVLVADLELADVQEYVPAALGMSGFNGEVRMMDLTDAKTGKPLPHERILMNLVKGLHFGDDVGAIIWDSIGATQSRVAFDELFSPKGEFGQAHMGKKPFLVGQVVDAISTTLGTKDYPATAIGINHVHQVIGGRGHTTPGGERKGYLAGVRLMLWTGEVFREDDEDDTSPVLGFHVKGQVEKLRFGGRGRKFSFYIVPGFGIHTGVSAMFDAFQFGLAERGARVKLNDKSLGYLKKDLLSYAAEGKRRKFYPFEEVMARYAEDVEKGYANPEEDADALQPSPVGDEADEG